MFKVTAFLAEAPALLIIFQAPRRDGACKNSHLPLGPNLGFSLEGGPCALVVRASAQAPREPLKMDRESGEGGCQGEGRRRED